MQRFDKIYETKLLFRGEKPFNFERTFFVDHIEAAVTEGRSDHVTIDEA